MTRKLNPFKLLTDSIYPFRKILTINLSSLKLLNLMKRKTIMGLFIRFDNFHLAPEEKLSNLMKRKTIMGLFIRFDNFHLPPLMTKKFAQ